MKGHPQQSIEFLKNEGRVNWHDETLWWVRQRRDNAAHGLTEWERLREKASEIKDYTLSHLDELLLNFEEKAIQNGIRVHWAGDAKEHNQIVHRILKEKKIDFVVKSKSMLTEECGLNHFLEEQGIEVIDTDLGERIVQWMQQKPSHIVLPAIHLKKGDIGAVFTEKLGLPQTNDAQVLTEAARQDMRKYFVASKVALTGVNFGLAKEGAFVVCTNEGNADMGVHIADVHIASMGIEKLIPKQEHLGVFLRLLARSATGQPITTYSSHFRSPSPGKEIHLILVDNGRSAILGKPDFRSSLKCIRCGACMNTCPVFRKTGGHSYESVIPGPIGAILSPHKDPVRYKSLPFASSLCGSCTAVCPVKIDIDKQLYLWRQELSKKDNMGRAAHFLAGEILASPSWFNFGSRSFYFFHKKFPALVNRLLKPFTGKRPLPEAAPQTFREWYKKNA
ncbi:MAG: lactate utilization protein [Cyclobacteriaceae bacterium]|nr:lactate utilization protein [Cyclobacteriaceae bacterium]